MSSTTKLNSFDELHFAFEAFQQRVNGAPAEEPSARQDLLITSGAEKVIAAVKRSKAELSTATQFDRMMLKRMKAQADTWYKTFGDSFDSLYTSKAGGEILAAYNSLFTLIEELERVVDKVDDEKRERTIKDKVLGLAGICFGFVLALIGDNNHVRTVEGPQRETVAERRERSGRFFQSSYLFGFAFGQKDASVIGKKVLEHPEQYSGLMTKVGKVLGFARVEEFLAAIRNEHSPLFEKLSLFALENIIGRAAISKVTENISLLKENLDKMEVIENEQNSLKAKLKDMDETNPEHSPLQTKLAELDRAQAAYNLIFDTIMQEQLLLRELVGKKSCKIPDKILETHHLKEKGTAVSNKPLAELPATLKRLAGTRDQYVIDLDASQAGAEGHALYVSLNPPRFCDIADRGIGVPQSKVREFDTVDQLLKTVALYTKTYQHDFPTFSLRRY